MGKRLQLFGFLVLAALAGAAPAGFLLMQNPGLGRATARLFLHGGPLLEIRTPTPGQLVPLGSIEVIVGFPAQERVASETFRCLLNNHDVTDHLTLGQNGAAGRVTGLIEGENRLRVEVFGRGWWPGRLLEDSHEILFRVQPLPNIDRA